MKLPALPASVLVGPYRYRVEVGGHDFDRARGDAEAKGLQGAVSHERQVIVLKEGIPHNYTCDTLLHETLHACFAVAGQPLDSDDEERAIGAVSATFLQTLRTNPELVSFLLHVDDGEGD